MDAYVTRISNHDVMSKLHKSHVQVTSTLKSL